MLDVMPSLCGMFIYSEDTSILTRVLFRGI